MAKAITQMMIFPTSWIPAEHVEARALLEQREDQDEDRTLTTVSVNVITSPRRQPLTIAAKMSSGT